MLDRLPDLPAEARAFRIEQGYLPDSEGEEGVVEGRLRRMTRPDGTVVRFHTIKKGAGLVREELERELSAEEFDALWDRTDGRRLRKTRHKVSVAGLTWEIDAFDTFDLVLAEVELPDVEAKSPFPPWLEPRVVRELTEDARYRNYCLATLGLPEPR